jgi:putative addiction module component (TIGR02574 family)
MDASLEEIAMSPALQNVLTAAESLSAPEQRELVERLLEKLDEPPGTTGPPQLSEAWKQEINKRSAEYDGGQTDTVAWEEVQARWRASRSTDG